MQSHRLACLFLIVAMLHASSAEATRFESKSWFSVCADGPASLPEELLALTELEELDGVEGAGPAGGDLLVVLLLEHHGECAGQSLSSR